MLQTLKRIARVVTEPIADIRCLADVCLSQHRRIEELESRVDRLSRAILLLSSKSGFVSNADMLLAINSDKPIDITVSLNDDKNEINFFVLQGEPDERETRAETPRLFHKQPTPSRNVGR